MQKTVQHKSADLSFEKSGHHPKQICLSSFCGASLLALAMGRLGEDNLLQPSANERGEEKQLEPKNDAKPIGSQWESGEQDKVNLFGP